MYSHQPYNTPVAQEQGRAVPVCLDYLKGICSSKRAVCKFSHPQLQAELRRGPKICEVYMLTGFCKFGSQCHDYHPPQSIFTPVCAPACTAKMTEESRDMADLTVPHDEEDSTLLALQFQQMASNRVIDDIQAGTASTPQLLTYVQTYGTAAITPPLYSIAIETNTVQSILDLYNVLDEKGKETFKNEIMGICGKLLYHSEDLMTLAGSDLSCAATLRNKRTRNLCIMGKLFIAGLFSLTNIESAIEFLLLRASKIDMEAAFHAQLLATFLAVCSEKLSVLKPYFLFNRTHRLRHVVKRHPQIAAEVLELTETFASPPQGVEPELD